jgi:hypothetical protein
MGLVLCIMIFVYCPFLDTWIHYVVPCLDELEMNCGGMNSMVYSYKQSELVEGAMCHHSKYHKVPEKDLTITVGKLIKYISNCYIIPFLYTALNKVFLGIHICTHLVQTLWLLLVLLICLDYSQQSIVSGLSYIL